ncbi:DUF6879 family protein [Kitasatospora cheerisanensis]|uniref:DUF6879 domain-containing protein n=1 Tax=Kitasatospora cheerisanensis KCTC 2395 TaxID=1348663 RepID=A0A066YGX6_9ACTN|nr:DUF6879 family protein [Kitasatospora cheerisanensis]KDN80718.1 hypothetical protein KCH_74980 [Kitasatospora cheerisanensis KCTC 2395]
MSAAPTLEELIGSAQRSAVHLELRDGYMRDDPMFLSWQSGHRHDQSDKTSWWSPWLDLIATATNRGVVVRRSRVVSEPLSEYTRFEYDVTFRNIASGEDVRWLARHRATGLALPPNDFWLVDDRILLVHHFSGEGDFVDDEIVADIDTVELCRSAFDAVWRLAVPHAEYKPS